MKSRWTLSPLALAVACTQSPSAKPADTTQAAAAPALLGDCVTAVLASKAGTIVKLEGKTENGVAVYEFDVRSPDGSQWDIECDAVAAKVTEVEQEVNAPTDEPFASKVKITADSAKAIALATYPGTAQEIEYEVEQNGDASYEIDILGADGKERKIEVDATRGTVTENNPELFQIGVE